MIFPGSLLQATAVSQSGSIFTLWPEPPTISGETVSFAGGLPSPGYTGTGKLFSITFKAKNSGTANISIANGRTLANNASAANVYAGSSGSVVTISKPATPLVISSSSHPDQNKWYKERTVVLGWNKPPGAQTFSYSLGTKTGTTTNTSLTLNDAPEGKSTFSLSAKTSEGDREASYQIQVDTVAPETFTIEVKQSSPTDPFPVFNFPAQDVTSGVEYYEITIGDQPIIRVTEPTYKAERLTPGKKVVKVVAFDRAGNSKEATTDLKIEGFPGPVITDFSRFISVLQPVKLEGTARLDAKIRLYVNGQANAEFVVKENLSEQQRQKADTNSLTGETDVEWSYFLKNTFSPGIQEIYAIQIKPDTSESNPSNIVTPRVLWTSIIIGGLSIPMMPVILILLCILVLLTVMLVWSWRHSRRAVGNWRERLQKLKKEVDAELEAMEDDVHQTADALEKKPQALKSQIKGEIEGTIKRVDTDLDQIISIAEQEEKKKN